MSISTFIKKTYLVAACLLFVLQGWSQSALPLDPAVKFGKLENGLTYYIRKNQKPEKKVELRLVVNTGAICEDDDQQGLAHMAEHMAFNGTKNFKKNEIVSFLQDIGVGFGNDLNAYTAFDETVYILPIPIDKPGNLEKGFQVLEDWAHQVTYLTEDIEGERAIILEESRLGKGADDRMFRKIYPKLFEGSKYANRLPIGIDSLIKNFPPDAIRRFYKTWYRPNLMAVMVVGDIEPAAAEALVRKHFSSMVNPDNPRTREEFKVPAYKNSEAMVVTDKEATEYAAFIQYPFKYKKSEGSAADFRESLVERIYTTIFNQRLQEIAQKENPPFVMAGIDFGSYARNYNGFSAYASSGTGDISKALEKLTEEIVRVKRFGFTQAELDRAKKTLLSGYEQYYNNRDKIESSNYIEEYIRHFLQNEPSPGIVKEYELVKETVPGISLADVNQLSNLFKDEKNKFVYVMGPENNTAKLPDGKALLALMESKEAQDLKGYEEKVIASSLLKSTPKGGKIVKKITNATYGTTEWQLSNGVRVVLKPTDFKNDQIILTAGRPGGKNNYGLADKYSAEFMTQVLESMGWGEFNPTDLKKALAGKTANAGLSFGPLTDGFSGSSSRKDVETLFQLLYLKATAPRKDTGLFNSFVKKNQSMYAMVGSNPEAAFIDSLFKFFYQNNPLAPSPVPNSSNFSKINIDRVLAIHKERFADASGLKFTLTGSFKEEELQPLVEKYLGGLPASGKQFTAKDNKIRPIAGKQQLSFRKGKEAKSLILGLFSGEQAYSEDLALKATVLSEVLNIRIIEELREKIQGIYGGGTVAQLEKEPYGHFSFILQLPCGPEKADTLIKAVQAEFREMVAKGPDVSYLDKVKKQLIEQHKVALKENGAWAQALSENQIWKKDLTYFTDYEAKVNALTVKDIQAAAKIFVGGSNQTMAVLLPEGGTTGNNPEKKKSF